MVDSILEIEERAAERRAVTVQGEVVRERGFRLLGREIIDLSPAGLRVRSDVPCELGEEVFVSFRVPGGSSWVDGSAEVVRVVHGRRRQDWGRSIGLRFRHLDAVSKAVLQGSLWRCLSTRPARSPRRDYAATVAIIGLL
jgi:hypothetical protein